MNTLEFYSGKTYQWHGDEAGGDDEVAQGLGTDSEWWQDITMSVLQERSCTDHNDNQ